MLQLYNIPIIIYLSFILVNMHLIMPKPRRPRLERNANKTFEARKHHMTWEIHMSKIYQTNLLEKREKIEYNAFATNGFCIIK